MIKQRTNRNFRTDITTGFGTFSRDNTGRYYNKNGRPNVRVTGLSVFESMSWYHTLINISTGYFLLLIFSGFILLNLIFTFVYALMGIEHLVGIRSGTAFEQFMELFYFSTQTFTTVGYGRISPMGMGVSGVATFEAFLGLLSFALATGLFYGRFAKPKAYLRFSENALLAPYKDITAIMMRVAPFKNATLVDAEAKVTLGLVVEENGKTVNKFFQLPLEYSTVNALTLSWTIVHPITETSPLYNFTKEDFENTTGEILVYLKAFDDMFSNTVVTRTSYTFKEIIIGAKFKPMYMRSIEGNKTILHLDKLSSYTPAQINFANDAAE